ncbi:type I restriction-modification system subunit M [Exiguobacterium aurantiacum]|uniref:site-specific DNA-methyltransferase (adenine-specific) n=1 Tax=Exiguobacterium aurantiacum TaxID=33987 RepID=A0ABY5FSG0_9BACL|nr:class I SAM-dependent DNA methyltransferase [Exiguobacterium aurantiacum]UTT44546.1 type I restriction-modification system subunit M [Exiguobacterium aurantiacum]
MELNALKNWLFEAANILRGPVDQSDYKAYIFPLLFLKRISDVYDEEKAEAIKLYGEDFLDEHRFVIPTECHWQDIRKVTTDLGQKIQSSMRKIEAANPDSLYGIFGDTQWTNKDKLSDALLIDLIEHFSEKNLNNENVNPNTMGDAYEFLIERFADLSNKKAGEFYTPRSVVRLMTMILDPQEKMSIYDPACGTGGMLLEAIDYLKKQGREYRNLKLYGNEKNLTTSAIAKINMFLHDITDFEIVRTDTLKNPTFFEEDKLKKFDLVIANPPFSLKNWGREEWENDERNYLGVLPPKTNGDFAWILHMLKSLKENGKMAVVLPHGVLFRSAAEQKIRKELIDNDYFETIIGLGPNLFYGTLISTSIIVLNKNKPKIKKNKVQFIDGSDLYKSGKAQNFMFDEHINKIYELYTSYENKEGLTAIATSGEIAKEDYNLTLTRYIKKLKVEDTVTLNETYEEMLKAYTLSEQADDEVLEMLLQMEEI